MNKSDFIDAVAEKAELSKAGAERALDAVLAAFIKVMQNNDSIILPGFGTIGVKRRAERAGRNPGTGAAIKIPAANVPFYRPSSKVKEVLNPKAGKK